MCWFQHAYNRNNGLPNFLNVSIHFWSIPVSPPAYSSFVEGWGLYSEYLGHELMLYNDDPYQLVGFYSFNLIRASRMVIDTGIHAMGWTRQQAVNYLLSNSALSKHLVEAEIDRYITWPGQATAYKTGEIKIKSVRRTMEQEFGGQFELKDFHRSVLDCFGPLELLEECVRTRMKPSRLPRRTKSVTNGLEKFEFGGSLFFFVSVAFLFVH